MTMQRWKPGRSLLPAIEEMYGLQHRINDFWQNFSRNPLNGESWMPAIDIYEKDDSYVVKAEIPGIKEEDVDVSVFGERLTIKGEKKAETEVKKKTAKKSAKKTKDVESKTKKTSKKTVEKKTEKKTKTKAKTKAKVKEIAQETK